MSETTRPPTIYDVAKAAGVAPSTVSRAFSRPGRVSAATAARVHAVAAELGYRVNPIARALQNGRTATVALVVSDVTNPVYFGIIRGVEAAAADAGYTMLLADAQESEELERTALERALSTVEGVVLAGSRMSDRAIRAVAERRPVVVLNRIVPGSRCVVPDTAAGVAAALDHLWDRGHRTVTYLAGPAASWADGKRWRSVLDSGPKLGLKVNRIGPCVPTMAGGVAAAREVLRQGPTAVLAYNDLLAIGLMRGLAEGGCRVPEQVSVVGFDNVFGADWCTPPLTTVATPLRAMGTEAFRELHRQIRGEKMRSRAVVSLAAQLVVRESTGFRSRKRTSPASGTTRVAGSARQASGSTSDGSR
ncbi:LacI family transcriptional regulator [Amycolatopsis sp. K13G38]|uniref:LacI family transcriptional regulator n=1 Tax=Amycolatopsis acididurans TaxID=2724524 RepID=A0ABX1IZA8_9PSEU|nr:LacI family transcriptional regulator [Amycolatopsis acididurans]